MKDFASKALRGTLTIGTLMALTAILGYSWRLIAAKGMSVEDFGLFSAVFALINFLYGFRSFGLGNAMVRLLSECYVKGNKEGLKQHIWGLVVIQCVIAGLFSGGLLLFSEVLALYYFHSQLAVQLLWILVPAFGFLIVTQTSACIFHSMQRMHLVGMVEFLQMLFVVGFSFVLLRSGFGVLAPALAYLGAFGIVAVITGIRAVQLTQLFSLPGSALDKTVLCHMLGFGLKVLAGTLGNSLIMSFGTMALTYFGTLNDVAFYSIAFPTANLLRYVPRALTLALLPLQSELHLKDKAALNQAMSMMHRYLIAGLLPIVLVMVAFPHLIITVLFGEGYLAAAPALAILSIGMLLTAVASVNQFLFIGANEPRAFGNLLIAGALANVTANLLLIPWFGTVGTALAFLASSFVTLIISSHKASSLLLLKMPWAAWIKTLVAGAIMLGVIMTIRYSVAVHPLLEAAIALIIAGFAYVFACHVLGVIRWGELMRVFSSVLGREKVSVVETSFNE